MIIRSVSDYTDRLRRTIESIDAIPSEEISTRSLGELMDLAHEFLIVAAKKNKERYCEREVEDLEVKGMVEVTINSTFKQILNECKKEIC